jgi:integrase/recombinase XerD
MEQNSLITHNLRSLTPAEFHELSDIPPELEWFGNLDNKNTRKAYERDVKEFLTFVGLGGPCELRRVSRAHVIAWRKNLEGRRCAGSTIRRKLAALSSLFKKLSEDNAVLLNPVDGVKRPKMTMQEGATPALSDNQTRMLLEAPPKDTLKGKRDRALLSTLAHHALRRDELCRLKVGDLQMRLGVMHLRVEGQCHAVKRWCVVHSGGTTLGGRGSGLGAETAARAGGEWDWF